jgi:DNA-binding transcriptional MerR regulator
VTFIFPEALRSYLEIEQMSEADGSIPTTVTRKRKRGSGFRYSTKKALERSKLSKEKARGTGLELESVRKALTYPCELLSDIGAVDLAECSTGSFGQLSLHSVDEHQEVRTEAGLANVVSNVECCNIVSIIVSFLECLILSLHHRVTILICKVE